MFVVVISALKMEKIDGNRKKGEEVGKIHQANWVIFDLND